MKPTLVWQFRFLKSFLAGNRADAPPFAMLVDVTKRCNLSCLHCRQHSPMASRPPRDSIEPGSLDFPLARFRDLCREAEEWGIRKVVLIGEGEPFLHPDLPEMIVAAKSAGCEVVLLTNGTLIDASMARKIVRTGLDELRFSLWASNVEEYRAQYPGTNPAFFQRAIRSVQHMVSARRGSGSLLPRIVLHRPIEPRFFRSLDATVTLAREIGCDAISFSPLKPLLPQDDDRLLTAEQQQELVPLLRSLAKKAKEKRLAHNTAEVMQRLRIGRAVWKLLPCYIGWIDMRVRVNGDVVPCDTCNWVMGNIRTQGVREIWNSPGYREFRRLGRSNGGITRSGRDCLCDFCCHTTANARLHRLLRWCPSKAAS